MILRLSQKLGTKIKAGAKSVLPLDENPLADWSGHLFIADRTQYIILSNTKSLFSMLMFAKGITNETQFFERALSSIQEVLEAEDQEAVYPRCIAPAIGAVSFAKPLNRSVLGSMNELIRNAKACLAAGGLSLLEVAARLNDVPLSAISSDKSDKYGQPKEAFRSLVETEQIGTVAMVSHPQPRSPAQWVKEIKLAIADARRTEPIGQLIGAPITDANLFHLAPLVCLKFRGRNIKGREANRVTKVALANYIANTAPNGIDHGLEHHPMMAFALCYVAAHLALDLVDEQEADAVLTYCEDHL